MNIRELEAADYEGWAALYSGYKAFYNVPVSDADLRTAFEWILDENHPQYGFVVENDGVLVALAHYQVHPNPLTANYRMYLNDLYVDKGFRKRGCAGAIIETLVTICQNEGFEALRWITAEDNYRARSLYDKLAAKSNFVIYDASAS